MTATPAQLAARTPLEPALIPIPAAGFLMGSDTGQDCERPIHRVWVDSFLLAATQVTNAEYARFLSAVGAPPPPFWNDPNFNHPQQPVTAVSWYEAARYCEWLSTQTARAYRLPTEAEWRDCGAAASNRKTFPGETPHRNLSPTTRPAGKPAPIRLPATPPAPSASTILATTSTNGAATGTTRTITSRRPSATRKAPNQLSASPPAVDRGAT